MMPGRPRRGRDVDDLRVEDLLDLVADDVVDRLQLELAGDRLLDAVDQRQLGVPLPRLVDEAGVLERHAEAARERGQADRWSASLNACVRSRFWSEITPVARPPDHERDEQRRADRLAAQHERIAVALGGLAACCRRSCSGSRVSITCLRKPISEIGSSGKRTPRSIVYGKRMSPDEGS